MTADEMIASSDVALNPCFKLLKYEKDRLIGSIGYVLSGLEELRGKIRYVRSQIDFQVTEVDEEEKKIAIASEECN